VNNVNLLELALLLPVLLISMMAHEVAHGYVAFRLGDPTAKSHGRLTLNPLKHLDPMGTAMFVITYLFGGFIFGWAKPVPVNPYYFRDHKKGMMLVGIAGPAMNMVVAILLSLLIGVLRPVPGTTFTNALFLAFQVNIVLGLFNLIPIPPLDGSRLLGGFLSENLYARWSELDRYGMLFIFLIFFVVRGPFFSALSVAYNFIAHLLLPAAYSGIYF
jgi:Zn-dependent protease